MSAGQAKADGAFLQGGQLPVSFLPESLVVSADDKDSAWKVLAGYRFSPYLAAELSYADYGSSRVAQEFTAQRTGTTYDPGVATVSRSVKSIGIDVVGGVPVGERFRVFGRLGWAHAEVESTVGTNFEATIFSGSFFSDTGEGLSRTRKSTRGSAKYGAGVEWSATGNLGVRLEWERVKRVGDAYTFKGVGLRSYPLYYLDGGTGEGGVDMMSAGLVWRF